MNKDVFKMHMKKARKLMKGKHYREARAVLNVVDSQVNNSEVKKMLKKLDKVDPLPEKWTYEKYLKRKNKKANKNIFQKILSFLGLE